MKVLFVRSGNNGIDPISSNQGDSLKKRGVEIIYFEIIGKGPLGYLKNIGKLRKCIKRNNPDILHAHYSFSGILSVLTFSGIPTGVSLMGSDVLSTGKYHKKLLKIFISLWSFTIVKSKEIYSALSLKKDIYIIPNGIDFNLFYPVKSETARNYLGWDQKRIHILFASDPERKEKNYSLAKSALNELNIAGLNFDLHFLRNIPLDKMVYYYNAADLLLLTSFYEGSPNVIKEAMACNCPIVATNVGDIREVIGETEGCYIASFDPLDVADKLNQALDYGKRTNGRENIRHLDNQIISQKIIDLYKKVVKHDAFRVTIY